MNTGSRPHSRSSDPHHGRNFNRQGRPRLPPVSSPISSRSEDVKSHPKTSKSLRQIPSPDDPVLCFCGLPAYKSYTEAFGEQYDCHYAHLEPPQNSTSPPSPVQISRTSSPLSDSRESSKIAWTTFAESEGKVQSPSLMQSTGGSLVTEPVDKFSVHHTNSTQMIDKNSSTAKLDRSVKPICAFHVHTKVWKQLLESYAHSVRIRDNKKAELTDLLLHNPELSCAWFNFCVCVTFDVFNAKKKISPVVPKCFCNQPVIMKELVKKEDDSGLQFGRIYFTCPNYEIDGARPKCTWILSAKDVPFVRHGSIHRIIQEKEENIRNSKEGSPILAATVTAEAKELRMNPEGEKKKINSRRHSITNNNRTNQSSHTSSTMTADTTYTTYATQETETNNVDYKARDKGHQKSQSSRDPKKIDANKDYDYSEANGGAWDDKKYFAANKGTDGEWEKAEETYEDDWINNKKRGSVAAREFSPVLNLEMDMEKDMLLPANSVSDDEVHNRILNKLEALSKPRHDNKDFEVPQEDMIEAQFERDPTSTFQVKDSTNGRVFHISSEDMTAETVGDSDSLLAVINGRSRGQLSLEPSSQSSEILPLKDPPLSQLSEIPPSRASSPFSTFSEDPYPQYGPTPSRSIIIPLPIPEKKTQNSDICPSSPCTADTEPLDNPSIQQVDDQANLPIKDLMAALDAMKSEYVIAMEEQEKEMQELREQLDTMTAEVQEIESQRSADSAKLVEEIEKERSQRISCQIMVHELEVTIVHLESERDTLLRSIVEDSEKRKKIKDLCRVCFEKPISTAIVPCFHVVLCEDCADKIHECAVCREKKVSTQRIYIG